MIGICTDSNSLLPPVLAERYGVEVVPLTVMVDEHEYLEGVDLDADGYYDMFDDCHGPTIEFGLPSPGQFAAAYDDLISRGCEQILSIHRSASPTSTLNAALLAAHTAPVPVRIIESGTARFGVSCCVWAAADAIAGGATIDEAATVAESLTPRIGNVFIVAGMQLVHSTFLDDGIGIFSLIDDENKRIGRAETIVDAVNAMAQHTLAWGQQLKVGIGTAHRDCLPIAHALGHAVGESAAVREVVHFRILPSVGFQTGPGTIASVMFPS